jgi:hypothetical protein
MLDRVVRVAMVVSPLCLVAAGAGLTSSLRAAGPQRLPADPQLPPASLGAPPALIVDAIVVDRKGAPVEDMRARDFEVIVDGRRRNGVAMARAYREPGAAGVAALRPATVPGEVQPIVEPSPEGGGPDERDVAGLRADREPEQPAHPEVADLRSGPAADDAVRHGGQGY